MIEYVVAYPFAVEGSNRIPLVLKNKPENLKGMWNLLGGKLNANEDAVTAAERELLEEGGLEAIQEYDPMVYYPSQYLGRIQGTKSIIHCVKVPISVRQELKPGPGETEKVAWHTIPSLFSLPNLMPNLRVTIPLMMKGVKNWILYDLDGSWRQKEYHEVDLVLDGMEDNPIRILVRSVKYFGFEEEE